MGDRENFTGWVVDIIINFGEEGLTDNGSSKIENERAYLVGRMTHFKITTMDTQKKLKHEQVQYIEFLSNDLVKAKKFYSESFGWHFTDYGPEYTAFEGAYVDGGFTTGVPVKGSILIVLYSNHIEATKDKVIKAGGTIEKDIYNFPGGKRFHFIDPDGYELAVWSE